VTKVVAFRNFVNLPNNELATLERAKLCDEIQNDLTADFEVNSGLKRRDETAPHLDETAPNLFNTALEYP
jgi:hypothetical protein